MILGKFNDFKLWKKLKKMITLFPHSIDDGKIILLPNKGFAIAKINKNSINDTTIEFDEDLSEFGCMKSKLKMTKSESDCCLICNRMDYKIGKKIKQVIEKKKDRKAIREKEEEDKMEITEMRKELKEIKEILMEKVKEKNKKRKEEEKEEEEEDEEDLLKVE
jgi:hypothetical protein